jgi:uncharacterized membrane protein
MAESGSLFGEAIGLLFVYPLQVFFLGVLTQSMWAFPCPFTATSLRTQ